MKAHFFISYKKTVFYYAKDMSYIFCQQNTVLCISIVATTMLEHYYSFSITSETNAFALAKSFSSG